jgi:hypothetical protein
MANRAHFKMSLPCKTPGCTGLLKCHQSRLIPYGDGMARRRQRRCELCSRVIETVEAETRILRVGTKGYLSKLGQ